MMSSDKPKTPTCSNPIISGFNPDPSVCRVGEDYYLVTSSFEFFPGVPLYHSRNLVNWELIGHCLSTDDHLPLQNANDSGGIYAPTLRYHDGYFYMITTNVSNGGNFIVRTKDIKSEWSLPQQVEPVGIDPSLLFDDDGKVYFCGTCRDNGGKWGIVLFEIDPATGNRESELSMISYGSGGKFPEGPHLYKINGHYYLMIAEGGTEYGHRETLFRSDNPRGPYEACPHNPILTHQNLDSPIQCTGHADLFEDQNGNWWLVCLGIRPLPGRMLHNLGRETFLAPVVWDADGWPIIGDRGHLPSIISGALPGPVPLPKNLDFEDDFMGDKLNPIWTFVRNPNRENYAIGGGKLILSAGSETLSDFQPTFVGVRQQAMAACAEINIFAEHQQGARAGITAYYNRNYHYDLFVTAESNTEYICLTATVHGMECMLFKDRISMDAVLSLRIISNTEYYTFYFRQEDDWIEAGKANVAGLCTEGTQTMTFTGTFLGLFASRTRAEFTSFSVNYET